MLRNNIPPNPEAEKTQYKGIVVTPKIKDAKADVIFGEVWYAKKYKMYYCAGQSFPKSIVSKLLSDETSIPQKV